MHIRISAEKGEGNKAAIRNEWKNGNDDIFMSRKRFNKERKRNLNSLSEHLNYMRDEELHAVNQNAMKSGEILNSVKIYRKNMITKRDVLKKSEKICIKWSDKREDKSTIKSAVAAGDAGSNDDQKQKGIQWHWTFAATYRWWWWGGFRCSGAVALQWHCSWHLHAPAVKHVPTLATQHSDTCAHNRPHAADFCAHITSMSSYSLILSHCAIIFLRKIYSNHFVSAH